MTKKLKQNEGGNNFNCIEHLAEFYSGIRFKAMGTKRKLRPNTEVKPVRI